MIEVVSVGEPKKLDITPEMALSVARVLRDYCKQIGYCGDCVMCGAGCEHEKMPYEWELPERGNLNGKAE